MDYYNTKYCNPSFHIVNYSNSGLLSKELKNIEKTTPKLGYGKRRFSNIPSTIYETLPNPLKQGSPLPRPYGPRDNLRLQSLYSIHGFGLNKKYKKRRSKKKSKKRSFKKNKSKKFGMTPGTQQWKNSAIQRNISNLKSSSYANQGVLKPAKGSFKTDINLLVKPNSSIIASAPYTNVPMQYNKNNLNTPLFYFGSIKTKKNKIKNRRSFGPNNVGYQKPIPMYHGGGNTINFSNNKLYFPEGIIPKVGKVQPDGMTPNAWLTKSSGIGDGLGKQFRFGSKNVYNIPQSGSGHLTISQPDSSTYGKGYSKYGSKKSNNKNKNTKRKGNLRTSFGGKVITLNSSGKITIN